MNVHEYQAKEILGKYGVAVSPFRVASSALEARRLAEEMGWKEVVLKIQVHAGGRGKAGGVKFAKSPQEVESLAKQLIGLKMINEQTGPEGIVAHQVLLSEPVDIAREFYLSVLIDRNEARPVLIASSAGGMDIEEVAHQSPEKILRLPLRFDGKIRSYQHLELAKCMGWTGEIAKQGAHLADKLAKCFIETDASLLEINPLVETKQGHLLALDAKLSIDDNALFRHPDLAALDDPSQGSPQEAAAKEHELSYIAMHGDIGCMVNGAGLAMATMDIIQLAGSSPANFLDVGGGATKEKVAEGFRIILSDKKVKAILVNIFGGIMNCATIAEGVIFAAKEQQVRVPIVVRLEGTNVEEGRRLFQTSGLTIHSAKDLAEAATLVVQLSKGKHGHFGK
ncbi:MAG TPA: ADP-forming succinate--CoA ligase subunit beta [Chlamydiales bacterium]|jgi:succinyl-CoA synthetase beta subunit